MREAGPGFILDRTHLGRSAVFLAMCGVVVVLSSCAGPNVKELRPGDPVPAASRQFDPAFEYEPEYLIRVGDEIRIEFLSDAEPANNASRVVVRPDGRISMRGVDDVLAAGRTPAGLDSLLTASFARILVDPSLSVIVDKFSAEKVYVIGSVRTPREIALAGPLSLLQGIAAAGGFTDGANRAEVVILRRQDQGKLAAFKINTDRIMNDPASSRELALRGQDIVFVPRSGVGQMGDFVTLYFRDVINPLLLTLLSIDELQTRHFLFE
ncbi:MAG TPA: polysaccharide biosynthesis/export family protein [Candidatus Udaeobacter sp.]|nr:polysaccharide biosynthesis/export family protein [Candidatus Udaeobacter sp.]